MNAEARPTATSEPVGEANEVERPLGLSTAALDQLAHDLRGPAGVIQGALQELEHALGDDAAKYHSLLLMALRGVRRITRNADRLQQLGQLHEGTARFVSEPCDVITLLRRSVESSSTLENRRNVSVDVVAPTEPLIVEFDEKWMGVVLTELASNMIRQAIKRAEVRIVEDPTWITIRFINDNPASIKVAPSGSKSSDARGLGLALSIVRDVVEAHGSELECTARETSEHREAEVHLRIPRVTPIRPSQARMS